MARSKETVGKKEKEKKKAKSKQEKEERRQERKNNNNKGKSLEDMMAYIDEYGNISSTPPDPSRKIEINLEDIQLGARPVDEQIVRKGVVTFFNQDKGYGFINDLRTQESIFVHANNASEPIKEKDKVNFEVESSPRGLVAINVVKIK